MTSLGPRKLSAESLLKDMKDTEKLAPKRVKTDDSDKSDTASEETDDRLQRMANAMRTVIEVRRGTYF
jgi:hypothetical protein